MEIWRDIEGYEDFYQISSIGRIRSKDRYLKTCGNGLRYAKGKIIKPVVCTNGYCEVHLRKDKKREVRLLHRVVAKAFIPNPDSLPEVNHKDENIKNNSVENLEWCTSKYNANYGNRNKKMVENMKKVSINQYDKDGNFIKTWDSIIVACRELGADASSIIRVCKGKQKTAVGYIWKYA